MTPSKRPLPPIVVPMYLCHRDVFYSMIRTAEVSELEAMWTLPAKEGETP